MKGRAGLARPSVFPMHRPPIAAGDCVTLQIGGSEQPGEVLAVSSWAFILARGADGCLYLDVAFNRSAVSWSRLVRLSKDVDPADIEAISAIADTVAYQPSRSDVRDVSGASALLPASDRLVRC